jgi:hypothetical protein
MYNHQKSKNSSDTYSRYNASLITSLVLFIQFLILFGIVKKYFYPGVILLISNKLLVLIFMIIIFIIVYNFYNLKKIKNNANKSTYSPTTPRKLFVFLIFVVSLILNILLINK